MWTAILALIQAIPVLGGIIDKIIPTRRERETEAIRQQKQRERQSIDDWVDRDSGPRPR